ncbi:SDR family NAD(P)-dependent oxidoreductase [Alteribacter aurantiacus]|uniref:SDR family NAD(P)-dependent oxidoreductase n=1 Tax=Alteribacter aurantiacus TaxID=254410 RepID=UPI000410A5F8|nr:SDR family NAD(P)-dependent oxidoreductase [Alteribacter aurantiacus]
MKNVLVTGGAGFIGSHVVDLLLEKKAKIIVMDNLSSGSLRNLEHVASEIAFYEGDITNKEDVEAVFQQHSNIDSVVHLAAQSKVGPSIENPEEDANININGTINVLEVSRKFAVKSFVFSSTAAVYGDVGHLPILEDQSTEPLSPYGVSKLSAEEYVKAYGRLYGMEVTNLRFANVYGPRQSAATESGVITIFIEDLLSRKTPVIFGDGEQTRDFIYVLDIAGAILAILYGRSNERNKQALYNVSSCSETTILTLLDVICKDMGEAFSPSYQEERKGDIKRSCLDNGKLVNAYDWKPQTSLQEGIRETVQYYKRIAVREK